MRGIQNDNEKMDVALFLVGKPAQMTQAEAK